MGFIFSQFLWGGDHQPINTYYTVPQQFWGSSSSSLAARLSPPRTWLLHPPWDLKGKPLERDVSETVGWKRMENDLWMQLMDFWPFERILLQVACVTMVLASKVSMVSKQTEAVNKGGEEFPSQSTAKNSSFQTNSWLDRNCRSWATNTTFFAQHQMEEGSPAESYCCGCWWCCCYTTVHNSCFTTKTTQFWKIIMFCSSQTPWDFIIKPTSTFSIWRMHKKRMRKKSRDLESRIFLSIHSIQIAEYVHSPGDFAMDHLCLSSAMVG